MDDVMLERLIDRLNRFQADVFDRFDTMDDRFNRLEAKLDANTDGIRALAEAVELVAAKLSDQIAVTTATRSP
ncbi:hypothetical protein [Candidatus Palauibacter sp.]|uniref:hypothetical protein n=1 Tax=Candidatus Palauibacter sp. TaxID=3101350 RepID=UPI003B5185F7